MIEYEVIDLSFESNEYNLFLFDEHPLQSTSKEIAKDKHLLMFCEGGVKTYQIFRNELSKRGFKEENIKFLKVDSKIVKDWIKNGRNKTVKI